METKENNCWKLPALSNFWSNQMDKLIAFFKILIPNRFVTSDSGNHLSS